MTPFRVTRPKKLGEVILAKIPGTNVSHNKILWHLLGNNFVTDSAFRKTLPCGWDTCRSFSYFVSLWVPFSVFLFGDIDNLATSRQISWLAAGLFCRVGAQTTPKFRENFRVSLRTIFSAVDTRTAVLVSTAKVFDLSARDLSQHWTPQLACSVGFQVHAAISVVLIGAKTLRCLSPKLGSQHHLHTNTLPSLVATFFDIKPGEGGQAEPWALAFAIFQLSCHWQNHVPPRIWWKAPPDTAKLSALERPKRG